MSILSSGGGGGGGVRRGRGVGDLWGPSDEQGSKLRETIFCNILLSESSDSSPASRGIGAGRGVTGSDGDRYPENIYTASPGQRSRRRRIGMWRGVNCFDLYEWSTDLKTLQPKLPTGTLCSRHIHRPGNRGGGGRGRLSLQLLDRRGAAPPTLDCRCRSFLFLFVFARELGSLQRIVGEIRRVLSFG